MALEVIYDRHHAGLLSFCRHMLRSREDAEDALQQTFASAFRALPETQQPTQLKPWLFTIARNRCLSMLRGRREQPTDEVEGVGSTVGLSERVEQRAELRELLSSLEHLPERQKSALVLSEVGDLDHSQVAEILDCETTQVKSLVYQARSALIADRRAREIPCTEIREQIATASPGGLRRGPLRRHLRQCQGCTDFRDEVRRQRGMLALALPVVPSLGLKESALAAAGIGGGGAAGGGGLIAALGASGVAKVAAVGIAATGATGGLVAADPGLVARAQAGVERVADGVGRAVSGTSDGRDGRGAFKAKGSLDWNAAQRTARQKTRQEAKARGAEEPPTVASLGPGDKEKGPGEDELGPPSAAQPGPGNGNAYAYGRNEDERGGGRESGRGQSKGRPNGRGRARGRPANRGVGLARRAPARAGGAARRLPNPDAKKTAREPGGSKPKPGKEILPKDPRGPGHDRGSKGEPGLQPPD